MQSCFKPPVKTYVIEGDHFKALQNKKIGKIIAEDIDRLRKAKINEKISNLEDKNPLKTLPMIV